VFGAAEDNKRDCADEQDTKFAVSFSFKFEWNSLLINRRLSEHYSSYDSV
jgi:hypothetical protein